MKYFATASTIALGIAFTLSSAATVTGCSSDDDGNKNDTTNTPDGGGGGDDASQPTGDGEPITAKANEWTWVDFPDSKCANGDPTGIGVNLGTSKDVFIYLEGGGACWDETTCYALKTASFVADGFKEKDLADKVAPAGHKQFGRDDATNPFKDMSFVYVPYCTGDVHAGDATQTYGDHVTHHAGRTNLEAFLKRIVPTFKDATRVVFGGSSAGGFGAAVNYWRAQEAFGSIRVDLLDDSGPPVDQKLMGRFDAWETAWNLKASFPPGCADCATNVDAVLPYYAKTYPNSRFALLSYVSDPTIRNFFALPSDQFTAALMDLATKQIEPQTNVKYFFVSGDDHTLLWRQDKEETNGTKLTSWLSDMLTDAASWTNVKP